MLVFPQLSSGCQVVYPVRKKPAVRTVVNSLSDGRRVVYSDADGAPVEWELRAEGLTLEERQAIEALHNAAGGRLRTFTFLDPTANLLARSEEFDQSAWVKDPLLTLTTGMADPFGGIAAVRVANVGAASQAVRQTLAAPGMFRYSFSIWARAVIGTSMTMQALAGAVVASVVGVTPEWRRYELRAAPGAASNEVSFGIELASGASVDLFGAQVDSQPAASEYKRTGSRGGVYEFARFASDELTVRAEGTDVYSAAIRIVSVKEP